MKHNAMEKAAFVKSHDKDSGIQPKAFTERWDLTPYDLLRIYFVTLSQERKRIFLTVGAGSGNTTK